MRGDSKQPQTAGAGPPGCAVPVVAATFLDDVPSNRVFAYNGVIEHSVDVLSPDSTAVFAIVS